jgi:D-alanine-D-alanine ligase-like ATP-grasp enzyme
MRDMNDLIDVRGMSVNEYCNFLESRALHLGIDVHELNMDIFFERMLISDEMYERAKWELVQRERYFDEEVEF